jgi:hypothetical protein
MINLDLLNLDILMEKLQDHKKKKKNTNQNKEKEMMLHLKKLTTINGNLQFVRAKEKEESSDLKEYV